MNLNPFDAKLESARRRTSELEDKLKKLRQDLAWYESNTIDEHHAKLEYLRTEAKDRARECGQYKIKADTLGDKIAELSKSINSLWNPKNWFDSKQRDLRGRASELKQSHDRAKEEYAKARDRMQNAELQKREKFDEISRYEKFDFDKTNEDRTEVAKRLSQQKKQIDQLAERKKQVDVALEPVLKQIRSIEHKKSEINDAIRRARKIDGELTDADNSFERAMAHQACEEQFGTGSPRKVISKKESELRRFDRDIEKLNKRARSTAEKAAREVRALIIDGNNLCYEGSTFLGLDVLQALVPLLTDSYDVTVVFDASIRRALNSGDSDVRDVIGPPAKVHVVATSRKADETVIDLATADKTTFIISNDRFAEFGEKPAGEQQRVIRHEIVSGQVIIHDLGISEAYR